MKKLALYFAIFISLTSQGQNSSLIDSLKTLVYNSKNDTLKVNLLNKLYNAEYSFNLKNAREYSRQALELSKKIKYPRGIAHSVLKISGSYYNEGEYLVAIKVLRNGLKTLKPYKFPKGEIEVNTNIGKIFVRQHLYDSALIYLNSSITRAKKINYYRGLNTAYLVYGNIYYYKSNYPKAIEYYLKLDSICTVNNFTSGDYAAALGNIASIKSRLKDYDQAIKYFNKTKVIYSEENNTSGVIQVSYAMGVLEIRRGNLSEAESLLKSCYDYYHKTNRLPRKNEVIGFLADIYTRQKKYNNAEDILIEGIKLSNQLKDSLRLAESYIELGKLNLANKDYSVSREKFLVAKKLGLKIKNELILKRASSGLSEAYFNNAEYEKAALEYKYYAQITDSLNSKRNKAVTTELEKKYQTEKKEQQIALLNSQKELVEQQKNNQRNLLLGGIGVTALTGLFFFFQYRNRQKTNKKLKELDALKSNFFANISHEFRTPLTLISAPIQEKLDSKNISKEDRTRFQLIQKNNNRLLELVDQLLDLSKIEAGKMQLRVEQGNPVKEINAIIDSFSYLTTKNSQKLEISSEKSKELHWFDKDVLKKITNNLLSNAVKFTPANGEINCTSYIKNNLLTLEVKNTGAGLTENEQNNLFNRFYQTQSGNTGTGIGLALVKELTTLHKGTITVSSKANKWTIFKVTLPVNKNIFSKHEIIPKQIKKEENTIVKLTTQETNKKVKEQPQTKLSLPILLVVEDNPDVRKVIKSIFSDNYKVLTSKNGEVGIKKAIQHIPDIIISDVMMPIKNGIELTNTLKNDERTSHIPIILLTAKAGDENELEGIKSGADDYITKPFNNKLLTSKVAKLIETRKHLQLRYSQEIILKPKDIVVSTIDEEFLQRVQHILDGKLIESSFNVEQFSKAIGMSRMQLHRKLKALTGLTTSEFIRSQRIKLAADLLSKSDINVSQIGYSVGFNDHSYFTKCFKDHFGCTPSEYHKSK
jgi:signal transduction histidine kinase/CheY-like chemotaxis protein